MKLSPYHVDLDIEELPEKIQQLRRYAEHLEKQPLTPERQEELKDARDAYLQLQEVLDAILEADKAHWN